ncbi:MAG: DNA recombination protein RmuC [Bryobacteraceae bacterium]|nr:DNA recombination protein RmuC [Bryobacteraceae bacterium]
MMLFFGLVAAFVLGAMVVWLVYRQAGGGQDEIVGSLKESLKQMEEKLHTFELARETSQAKLSEQIRHLASCEVELQKETARLSSALRSPGVKGRWGELQLRRVVELAGMTEHVDFNEQAQGGEEGKRVRPDMLVRLPNGRLLVIDAKTPMGAYLEAMEASDDNTRAAKLKEFAGQVRAQVVRLSAKSYWEQFENVPEFVILFLPGESFFSAALMQEPELLEYGADRRVILATPTTLIALMKTVAYGWRQQTAEDRAEEIRVLGSQLYDRLRTMAVELSALGSQLERTVQVYNRAVGAWDTRVLPGAKRIYELGAGSADEFANPHPVDTPVRMRGAGNI